MDGDTAFSAWGTTGDSSWYGEGSSSFDWNKLAGGLTNLAGAYLQGNNAVRLQQASNGQRYVEGQPIIVANQGGLTLSPTLLLLAGIAAFVMLAKG